MRIPRLSRPCKDGVVDLDAQYGVDQLGVVAGLSADSSWTPEVMLRGAAKHVSSEHFMALLNTLHGGDATSLLTE